MSLAINLITSLQKHFCLHVYYLQIFSICLKKGVFVYIKR